MPSDRFTLFTIFGIRVGLDPSWILLAGLLTWSLATGYFPDELEGLDRGTAWALGGAGAIGLFLSIILHELSHALVAQRFGIEVRGITLFLFGGVAEIQHEPPGPRAEFLIAIAGPITSYALAALFWGVGQTSSGALAQALWGYLALINAILASFNLVPAFPLDGGRVLRAALWHWSADYARATRIAARGGRVFGILLLVLSFLHLLSGYAGAGLWLGLIGFFVFVAANATEADMVVMTGLEGRRVGDVMVGDVVCIPAETPLATAIEDYFLRYRHTAFPVMRSGRVLGLLRLEDLGRIAPEDRAGRTAAQALPQLPGTDTDPGGLGPGHPSATVPTSVSPQLPALEAWRLMQAQGTGRLLVIEDDLLRGVVTLRDIAQYLDIHQRLATGRPARL